MNRSPLHEVNVSLGARFVEFGGWEMPVQYTSVLDEHRAVRNGAGLFDVTHLGRFELTGDGAHAAMRKLVCNDIDRIEPGRCQYTMVLNPSGGVVDDMIVWWWDEATFWVMPNAANQSRVMAMFATEPACDVADLQMSTVMIALQGPGSLEIMEHLMGDAPPRFETVEMEWEGSLVHAAGTGYTGEPGGELCTDPVTGQSLMRALLEAKVTACGLGARDTLRLEAGLPLWGHELDESTTPLEAGLGFAISLDHEFEGRDRLVDQTEHGVDRELVGVRLSERGVPRSGYAVRTAGGGGGVVTSGNMSPMLGTGIGMAYVSPPPEVSDAVEVEIRNRWVAGSVVDLPFYAS